MSVASILSLVFSKRKEEVDAISDSYHSMLVQLASGEDLDLEEVRSLTVDAGKSKEECEADLELMQKRLGWVKEIADWRKVESTLPGLQTKYAEIKSEMDAVIAKLQPQLIHLEFQINAASDAGAQCIRINDRLNHTCLNKALIERCSIVGAQRQALMQKRRPLYDDLQKARQLLSYFNARLGNFENRKDGWEPKGKQSAEVREMMAQRDDALSTIDQLERAIRMIDDEVVPYDQEIADIGRQKLQP